MMRKFIFCLGAFFIAPLAFAGNCTNYAGQWASELEKEVQISWFHEQSGCETFSTFAKLEEEAPLMAFTVPLDGQFRACDASNAGISQGCLEIMGKFNAATLVITLVRKEQESDEKCQTEILYSFLNDQLLEDILSNCHDEPYGNRNAPIHVARLRVSKN